jgi:Flp pilus assembly protein TadG
MKAPARYTRILATLGLDKAGAAAVEFAMVAPVLITAIMGGMDLGYEAYTRSLLQGALNDIARTGSLEGPTLNCTGDTTEAQIECAVKKVSNAAARNAIYDFKIESYYEFSGVGRGEKLITDYNSNGQYDPGDCFQDLNENQAFDLTAGRQGIGGADDVVFYDVTMTMPRLLPVASLLGWSDEYEIRATTAIRNQPYTRQKTPPTVCV